MLKKKKQKNSNLHMQHTPQILPGNPNGLFFIRSLQHSKNNWLVAAQGPDYVAQASAILEDKSWTVLNAFILGENNSISDPKFVRALNALKVSLQTYGPTPSTYPFTTQRNTHNEVFHTNILNGKGVYYEVEWAIVDAKERIMALVGFAPHENYRFKLARLTHEEKQQILQDPKNIAIMQRQKESNTALVEKAKKVMKPPVTPKEQERLKALAI